VRPPIRSARVQMPPFYSDQERSDAERTERSARLVEAGSFAEAERELIPIYDRRPAHYELEGPLPSDQHQKLTQSAAGGYFQEAQPAVILGVKCWTKRPFEHYVQWHNSDGRSRSCLWFPSAYPRACFLRAVIAVEQERWSAACEFLEAGVSLEPTNPNFVLEQAALRRLIGPREAALGLLASLTEVSAHVSPRDLGGAGIAIASALIDEGKLELAEEYLMLALGRCNDLLDSVRLEMQQIAALRAGASATRATLRLWRSDS